jgi:hypothetical protein
MTVVIIVIGLLTILFLLFVAVGIRSRMIFVNPGALSDRQIDTTVAITRQIMARARPGSASWARAAAKHKAALDEQMRRKGKEPMSEVEIVAPTPKAKPKTKTNRKKR